MPVKNKKILIVDDDLHALDAYKRQLRKDFSVEIVQSGEKGLEAISWRGPFAVVLSDLSMPGMDGFEFLAKVGEIAKESIKMIITGNANLQNAIKAVNEGYIFRFITKPASPEELINALNAGIEQYRLEQSEKELIEKIKMMSITDALTSCYNRGYLESQLPKEIKKAQRYKRALSIIMCDIDHFKAINDTHGHQSGDYVLKMFAWILNKLIRNDSDWISRYGGEEFVIVLPETKTDSAFILAERIRNTITESPFETNTIEIEISASFGVTGFDKIDDLSKISAELMLKKADILLYKAKDNGRNNTVWENYFE